MILLINYVKYMT